MGEKIMFRCGLIDFQVGRSHGKLSFDPREYVRACAGTGMKRLIFTCKDAYGDAYYDSRLVERNPMAGMDYFRMAIEEAHRLELEIYAYYNVLLDDIYADENPGHRMIQADGEKAVAYDYYKILCPNSPYMDTVRERIAELVDGYDIDGIFLDITYFPGGTCFCGYCREKFRGIHGFEPDPGESPGTAEFAAMNEFRRNSRAGLLGNLLELIKGIKDIPVIWNGSGSIYLAEPEIDMRSDYLTTEFHAPDYLDGLIRTKWMQSRGRGFIMSTPVEIGSWGDWTMVPENVLRSTVASISSHGGGVFVNYTPYPSGEFAKSRIPCIEGNIKKAYEWLESYEGYLAGAKSAADTAIVFSVKSKRMHENGFAGKSQQDYIHSLKGSVRMMLGSGIPFDVADESTLMKCGGKYRVLVIPGLAHADEEFIAYLESYVGEGGIILSAGETALLDEAGRTYEESRLATVLGTSFRGFSDISVEYMVDLDVSLDNGVPAMPVLLKSAGRLANEIAAKGARTLAAKCLPPFEAVPGRHVYHQHAHPFKKTGYASVVKNKFGNGTSIHFSADIFRSFYKTASPWLARMFINALESVHGRPVLKLKGNGRVFPILLETREGYLLSMLNISAPALEPGKIFPEETAATERLGAVLRIRADKITVLPKHVTLPFEKTPEGIEFTIDMSGVHQALFIGREVD